MNRQPVYPQTSPYQTMQESQVEHVYPSPFQTQVHRDGPKIQNQHRKGYDKPVHYETKETRAKYNQRQQIKTRESRRYNEDFFERELQSKTQQAQRMLQDLQDTQKNLFRSEKECWVLRGQCESDQKRLHKLQKELSNIEECLQSVTYQKEQGETQYQKRLQDMDRLLQQKDQEISRLKLEISLMSREKDQLKKDVDVLKLHRCQPQPQPLQTIQVKEIQSSKISTIQLESTSNSLSNKFLPPPYTSIEANLPQQKRCYRGSNDKIIEVMEQNLRAFALENQRLKESLNVVKENYYERQISQYKISQRNQHPYLAGQFDSSQNPASQTYRNPSRKYNDRPNVLSGRRFSYEYDRNTGLSDLTRHMNSQAVSLRRNRRQKTNDQVLKRCKMILREY